MTVAAPTHRRPTHPGAILRDEFLVPRKMQQKDLAAASKVKAPLLCGIIAGRRSISARTAWGLAAALDTTPEFWMNLQVAYDLALAKPKGAS